MYNYICIVCELSHHLQLFWEIAVRPWLEINILFKVFGYKSLKLSIEKFAGDVIKEIVEMAKVKKLDEVNNNDIDGMKNRKITMVDLEQDGFSEEQLLQEAITLIVSGQDTSASANSAALFLLSMNQQVQQEVTHFFLTFIIIIISP